MAKHKTYEVKDYGSGWAAKEITSDMNDWARQGYEVQHTLLIGYHNEVSRYPDPLPCLNDGDSISSLGTMRVVYVK
jgi:hypothetical protein